jgi:DNA-binding NtrC family response regulator
MRATRFYPVLEEPVAVNREDAALVLVVGDNQDHNEALAKVLVRAGYGVAMAGDGEQALTILRERPFNVVITDLRMPRINGLDLLRHIRIMSPHVAVVVVTAHGEWTTYLNAMNIGAMDYLTKPVRREDILLTVRKALARRGIRAPEIPPAGSEESEGAAP